MKQIPKVTFPTDNSPLNLFLYYPWRETPFHTGTQIDFQVQTDQTGHADYSRSDFSTAFVDTVTRRATVIVDFYHRLSRMQFQLKNGKGYSDLESLQSAKIRILHVNTGVVYDLATKTILSSGNPQTVTPYEPQAGWSNNGSALTGVKAIVAPQTFPEDAKIEVTVDDKVYLASLAGVDPLASGKSRLFTVTVGSSGIELSVTLHDWDADGEDEFYGEEQDNKSFITQWRMQAAGDSVVLPLRPKVWDETEMQQVPVSYNLVVNWGDGSRDTIQGTLTKRPVHYYAAAGDYTVTISGECPYFSFGSFDEAMGEVPRPRLLVEVLQWGEVGFKSMEMAFLGCESLTKVPEKIPNVSRYDGLFQECRSLTAIPANLFQGCTMGENFSCAFARTGVQVIPAGLFDDCENAQNFNSVFDSTFIQSIPADLFAGCPNIRDISHAFMNCFNLKTIPAGLFANCANVTGEVYHVFSHCTALKTLPADLFANCLNITGFQYVFFGCSGLETLSEDIFAGCSEVTSFNSVFENCSSLTAIPDSLFADCSKVTSFYAVFQYCSSLTAIPTNLFKDNKQVTNFNYAFAGCGSLSGYTPYADNVELWDRSSYNNHVDGVYGYGCFNGTNLSANLGKTIPSTWKSY